jgi:hypothetical protein
MQLKPYWLETRTAFSGGHGVQFSGYIGDRMARLIGGQADANPLAGKRFSAIPGHLGTPGGSCPSSGSGTDFSIGEADKTSKE